MIGSVRLYLSYKCCMIHLQPDHPQQRRCKPCGQQPAFSLQRAGQTISTHTLSADTLIIPTDVLTVDLLTDRTLSSG